MKPKKIVKNWMDTFHQGDANMISKSYYVDIQHVIRLLIMRKSEKKITEKRFMTPCINGLYHKTF